MKSNSEIFILEPGLRSLCDSFLVCSPGQSILKWTNQFIFRVPLPSSGFVLDAKGLVIYGVSPGIYHRGESKILQYLL